MPYEFPIAGMATHAELLLQGEAYWHRDLTMLKETGFDSIRIWIGI